MQQQQKTSAFGKPNVDLFIARTDTRQTRLTTNQPASQPASQSNSTQLKAGIGLAMGGTML